MNDHVLQAMIIDTSARVKALEACFSGYVGMNEPRPVSCEIMMTYYKNHIEFLREEALQLFDRPYSEKLAALLIEKSEESQASFDRFSTEQRMAEEIGWE